MKTRFFEILGKRFGRLLVLRKESGGKWICRCDCGRFTVSTSGNMRSGRTKSCGCLHKELASARMKIIPKTHGMTHTRTYRSWIRMKQRCEYKKDKRYGRYGGRGIKICSRWKSFENFLADMGERPPGRTLGRINPDGNYEPSNCSWQTPYEQRHNRSKS